MFSVKGEPLAQAHIRNESVERLVRLPDELTGFLEVEDRRKDMSKMGGAESAISDLRYGLSGVSFKAHVIKKSEVRAVTSKDGNPLLVCSVTLSDGTGAIPLTIWNNQINTIREGAKVGSFRGEIQLSLSRKTGVLSVLVPANKELAEAPTISSVPSSFSSPSSP